MPFVLEGESENKLNYLLDNLTSETHNFIASPGIRFKHDNEFRITQGPLDEVIPRGDLVSTYQHIPIEYYCNYGSLNPFSRIAGLQTPFAPIQLNRGCRAACTFCAVRDYNGKGVRSRSTEETLMEMEYLVFERGIKHFELLDDDFLRYESSASEMLQGIIDRKLPVTWSANNGLIATSLNKKVMDLIRDSGCIGFKIGIETGNAQVMKDIKKPGTINSLRKVSILLQEYPEVFVGGNFIIGFPNETFSQMMDSFWFSNEMNLDWYAFTLCQVIRGAEVFDGFGEYLDDRIKNDGKSVQNFIPTRDNNSGEITSSSSILAGLAVFNLAPGEVPNKDQVKEIWFSFNLVENFINNKNLKRGGHPEHFIAWVSNAQVAYPNNPYMCFFLALAHLLREDELAAKTQFKKMVSNLDGFSYWNDRFDQFQLAPIVNSFPQSREQSFECLEKLRSDIFSLIPTQVELLRQK